ncbi:hypothetical protein [Falsihalocynthiibacter arcticus]|uniref:hypothetical protein n=1 Tax=Falsihalocynthiibacter arcticus TaxID=1579316 RepID=UPI0012E6F6F2|nr:hypothetical protein [Falsihalocynthiibacter arcticus]
MIGRDRIPAKIDPQEAWRRIGLYQGWAISVCLNWPNTQFHPIQRNLVIKIIITQSGV